MWLAVAGSLLKYAAEPESWNEKIASTEIYVFGKKWKMVIKLHLAPLRFRLIVFAPSNFHTHTHTIEKIRKINAYILKQNDTSLIVFAPSNFLTHTHSFLIHVYPKYTHLFYFRKNKKNKCIYFKTE